jgi:outer membrane protein OmpA-like peptidoglycan-associated protein
MADSTTSFWKSTALFLLLALVGVYLLYDWYDGTLQAQLARKETYIAQTVSWIKAGEARTVLPEDGQDAIRSAILTLEGRHRQDQADLKQKLAAERTAKSALAVELEELNTAHDTALSASQDQLTAATAELERLNITRRELEAMYREAKSQAVDSKLSLDQLRQTIVDTTAEHQARITELEHHLNERVTLARTTPLDSELLRMATAAGVLPPSEAIAADQQALTDQLAEVQLRLEAVQTELDAARAEAMTARNQLAEVQQQLDATQAELAQVQTRTAAEVATATTAAADAQVLIFELQQQLAQVKTQAAEELATATAATGAAQQQLVELQQQLAQSHQIQADLTQVKHQAATAQAEEMAALTRRLDAAVLAQEEWQQKHDLVAATLAATQQQLTTLETEWFAARAAPAPTTAVAAPAPAADERVAALETELATERSQRTAAEQTAHKIRALYAGFAALGATYTPRGLQLRLMETDVRFSPGLATLPSGALPSVTRIAELLQEQPTLQVRIEGHTDRSGGEELNKTLSQQRAEAVKQALLARGVAAERVTVEGIGVARPIADNASASGRSQNRRIELYLTE